MVKIVAVFVISLAAVRFIALLALISEKLVIDESVEVMLRLLKAIILLKFLFIISFFARIFMLLLAIIDPWFITDPVEVMLMLLLANIKELFEVASLFLRLSLVVLLR